MKKVIWIVVVVLVVLFISGSCSAYNRMVTAEETVNTTWADVEAQYQRRSDLIPNLVNTVKGYAAHEQSTFTEVVEARAQAMSFKLDAADLTPEKLAEFQQAQQKVGSALGRLIAVAERYPDLKANQNFLELQAQLEGTENRIAVARTRFNDATRQYNVTIRRFPANLIAGMFGFDQKAYFAAEEGAQIALALVLGDLAHPIDEVKLAAVEVRAVILGEVGGRDGCAPFDRAAVRRFQPEQHAQQRRLADAGGTEQTRHTDTRGKGNVVKHGVLAVALAKVFDSKLHHAPILSAILSTRRRNSFSNAAEISTIAAVQAKRSAVWKYIFAL